MKKEKQRIAAFFDIDHTLVDTNASSKYIGYFFKKGKLSPKAFLILIYRLALHRLNLLKDNVIISSVQYVAGWNIKDAEKLCAEAFTASVEKRIVPSMEKRVRLHEQQGDKIVLLTSMPELMALPFKHRLKCDDVLSTKLEEKNGAYTGRVTHLNYDKGKIKTMESYTRREGINVAQSYFYADSWTDKSAMELVGHPIAVNPDKKLKRYAKEKGWEILRF